MPSTSHTEKPWALIMAAGRGSRLAAAIGEAYKQCLLWHGAPLYWHAARALSRSGAVAGVVFVFPEQRLEDEKQLLRKLHAREDLGMPWLTAGGGELRQDSVHLGLAALPPRTRFVLIHDAARPFVSPALVRNVCESLQQGALGVVPALPVTDTIKTVKADHVLATLPREQLVAAQTPQGFDARLLHKAHQHARGASLAATDDATLMEMAGHAVRVITGEAKNVKITRPEDLALLEDAPRQSRRIGMGYDVHRYGKGRPLKLGGIAVPEGMEVLAHSDGDVLLHALMDALLGCVGLGDIGALFPDSDACFDNIASSVLLCKVLAMTREAGMHPEHADMTIAAQTPRIDPYREKIRNNIARLLNLPRESVNVKATTEEGMGFIGKGEGIKAWAVVSAVTDYG
ncbi:bifunctional enzyme IspD/IspF [Deltaproteobacteria bacterium]|nr:bifunctional enzyme IspD/IspF [Deltaproteobacteria bacterium]